MVGCQHRGYRSQYPGGDRAGGAVPRRRRPGDLLRDGRRRAGHRRIRGRHRHAVGAVGGRVGAAADHHSAGGQRAAGGAPHRALRHDRPSGAVGTVFRSRAETPGKADARRPAGRRHRPGDVFRCARRGNPRRDRTQGPAAARSDSGGGGRPHRSQQPGYSLGKPRRLGGKAVAERRPADHVARSGKHRDQVARRRPEDLPARYRVPFGGVRRAGVHRAAKRPAGHRAACAAVSSRRRSRSREDRRPLPRRGARQLSAASPYRAVRRPGRFDTATGRRPGGQRADRIDSGDGGASAVSQRPHRVLGGGRHSDRVHGRAGDDARARGEHQHAHPVRADHDARPHRRRHDRRRRARGGAARDRDGRATGGGGGCAAHAGAGDGRLADHGRGVSPAGRDGRHHRPDRRRHPAGGGRGHSRQPGRVLPGAARPSAGIAQGSWRPAQIRHAPFRCGLRPLPGRFVPADRAVLRALALRDGRHGDFVLPRLGRGGAGWPGGVSFFSFAGGRRRYRKRGDGARHAAPRHRRHGPGAVRGGRQGGRPAYRRRRRNRRHEFRQRRPQRRQAVLEGLPAISTAG